MDFINISTLSIAEYLSAENKKKIEDPIYANQEYRLIRVEEYDTSSETLNEKIQRFVRRIDNLYSHNYLKGGSGILKIVELGAVGIHKTIRFEYDSFSSTDSSIISRHLFLYIHDELKQH